MANSRGDVVRAVVETYGYDTVSHKPNKKDRRVSRKKEERDWKREAAKLEELNG